MLYNTNYLVYSQVKLEKQSYAMLFDLQRLLALCTTLLDRAEFHIPRKLLVLVLCNQLLSLLSPHFVNLWHRKPRVT